MTIKFWEHFFIQALFSYGSTIGFAICINVPRRALNVAGLAGMASWLTYVGAVMIHVGRVMGCLLGAFIVGVCGIVFARIKHMPVIVFNIPAMVPLVPGATAYQAIRCLALGQLNKAMKLTVLVGMIAGAMAVGFMIAQVVSELSKWLWQRDLEWRRRHEHEKSKSA